MYQLLLLLSLSASPWVVSAQEADDHLSVSTSVQRMAAQIYMEEVKTSAKNVVISPLSIHMAMSLLLYGAQGNSRSQLEDALGLEGVEQNSYLEEIKEITEKYGKLEAESLTLNVANALYVADDIQVKTDYKDLAEDTFNADVDNLNFTNSKQSAEVINRWAADKTNNLIKNLVSEGGLATDTRMVIMNAVYFKAKWLEPFDVQNTRKGNFSVPSRVQVETDFMFLSTRLEWAFVRELNASVVALPYIYEDYKMLVFLPLESSTVEKLEMALFNSSKPTMIEEYLEGLEKRETDLLLPKFTTGSEMSLVRHFVQLRVTDIFSNEANFTGITEQDDENISEIVHKTKLKVSEEGSEAAAATIAFSTKLFIPNPKIILDRPFIFFIFDTANNIPLFMGKIVDPSDDYVK